MISYRLESFQTTIGRTFSVPAMSATCKYHQFCIGPLMVIIGNYKLKK
jgi:hypothetical protein